MTPLRRWFVSSLLGGVLGFQALVALPPNHYGAWYWPFMDYPMYSPAHSAGEEIEERRLEGLRCTDYEPLEITPRTLGVQFFNFDNNLNKIANGQGARQAGAHLEIIQLVRDKLGDEVCLLRIEVRSVRLGAMPRGGITTVPWRIAAEIPVE